MARVLGVSSAGYDAWRSRPPCARSIADDALLKRVRTIHAVSRGTYGAPRVHADLRAQGCAVGKKRIARLMRTAGIVGVSRRHGIVTTRRDRHACPAPDLVDRNFAADRTNQLWVGDIMYVPTAAGFLYLAVVLDAFSRRIVGWSMETHLRTELVLAALEMAIGQRKPCNVIHHRPGQPVYGSGIRWPLSRGRRPAVHGICRRRLRQRHVRELLCNARVRAVGTAAVRIAGRGQDGGLQLHRRLVQPCTPPFQYRLSVTHCLRGEHGQQRRHNLSDKLSTKPEQVQGPFGPPLCITCGGTNPLTYLKYLPGQGLGIKLVEGVGFDALGAMLSS